MKVLECKPDVGGFKDCGVVFSGLDQDVAGDIGESPPCLIRYMGNSR
jgi:hypothetical protein